MPDITIIMEENIMKIGKRILSVMLTLCMVMGPAVSSAGIWKAQAAVFGAYEYADLSDETVKITKYAGADKILEVPETMDGKRVVSIGAHAFDNCDDLTEISLPSGLTSIENSAFSSCDSLIKVSLPSGVTSIGAQAFDLCGNLKEINLPPDLTSIEELYV